MANTLRQNERNTSQGPGNYVPADAIQERAVSENPNAGPQGAGWKEEEAYTLEARHHVQMVAAPLTKGSATGEGVNAPGRRQEDDVNIVAYALGSHAGSNGDASNSSHASGGPVGMGISVEETPALRSGRTQAIAASGVRRLTPRECERLQGLPDDWTLLNDKTPDSRRYSALGDAVTATVSEWIGLQLARTEAA